MKSIYFIYAFFLACILQMEGSGRELIWRPTSGIPSIYARGVLCELPEIWVLDQDQDNGRDRLLLSHDGGVKWSELCLSPMDDYWRPKLAKSRNGTYMLMNDKSVWTSSDGIKWESGDSPDSYILNVYVQDVLLTCDATVLAQLPLPLRSSLFEDSMITSLRRIGEKTIVAIQRTTTFERPRLQKSPESNT